jgi:Domain of unknown function (DUF1937)
MSFYYLSNPYNGTEEQKADRARAAARACGLLLKNNVHVWSPIVHNHAMMQTFDQFTLEERRSKILEFDFSLLRASCGMIVLQLPGWEESFGVKAELNLCTELGIPVHFLPATALDGEAPLNRFLPFL